MYFEANEIFKLALLGICFIFPLIAYFVAPKITRALLLDLRFPRILYYVAIGSLGISLFLKAPKEQAQLLNLDFWLRFALMTIAFIYAAIFAIVTNNIADLAADKISNPNRPLVKEIVDQKQYLLSGILSLIFALSISMLTQIEIFWGILAISIGYFVYSCPPLRLKRIPGLAKFLIGLNAFFVAVMGFTMVGGNVLEFPLSWAIFILLPLSLAANFIDLKDIEGDRATGIQTLPVLIGEANARHLMAFAALACYVMGGFLLNLAWAWPINLATAATHIFFLYRKPFSEKMIFLILVGALFGLDVFLFFTERSILF